MSLYIPELLSTFQLASLDRCCLLLPGFARAQWKGLVRANFSGSLLSSHTEGTLTLEIICVVEFLIMKGLWLCPAPLG